MGLDMYLYRAVRDASGEPAPVDERPFAYWRKNWALHEFIDKTFGGSERNPLDLELNREQANRIVEALRTGELKTPEAGDLQIFEEAARWLADDDPVKPKLLFYCADW